MESFVYIGHSFVARCDGNGEEKEKKKMLENTHKH